MCGRYNVHPNGDQKAVFVFDEEQIWTNKEAVRRFLMWDGVDGSPCDKLIKRELLQTLRFPSGYICEDLPVIYKVLEKANQVVHIGKPKYFYYQRSGSTSHSDYTPKTRGMVMYPKEIYLGAVSHWPDLKEEAEYYYFISAFNTAKRHADTSDSKDTWLEKELAQCWNQTKCSPKITNTHCMKFFLFKHEKVYRFL